MFSVGLFTVAQWLSDVLKNNNSCVLNQNTTNELWFIHHSFVFSHILYDWSFDYVINSIHNCMTCNYRDLSFLVNCFAKNYICTCATMLLHVLKYHTEPKTFEDFSILNKGNTFIISVSQKYKNTTTLFLISENL